MRIILFLVVQVALLLSATIYVGCGENDTSGPTKPEDAIVPLSVGNYWAYVDTVFDSGVVTQVDSYKVGVTGTTTITHSDRIYEVFLVKPFDMETDQPNDYASLRRNESDGLWSFGTMSSMHTRIVRSLLVKYPVSVGDTWQHAYIETSRVECVAVNEEYETPAGTFKCHVYKFQTPHYDIYSYYVPTIGAVAHIAKQNGEILFKQSLFRYHAE